MKNTLSRMWLGKDISQEKNKKAGKGFGYSLAYPDDSHTRTITARYGSDGAEALIYQPDKNPRKLTPRECARLQGFPEDYKIVCSNAQAYNNLEIRLVFQ